MAKRLMSRIGPGLAAGLLASLVAIVPAHAGSKVEGGKIENRTKQKSTLAVGALKGKATQGSILVEKSKLKNVTVRNYAEMDRSLCVGVLKGTCHQGSVVIQ